MSKTTTINGITTQEADPGKWLVKDGNYVKSVCLPNGAPEWTEVDTKWDFAERPIRIFLSDSDLVSLLKEHNGFINKIEILRDFIVPENLGQYIYLEEVYEGDGELLGQFLSFVFETNPY
jgi:hypothetical protein